VFRNVAYIPRDQVIRLFTWDENGKRISYDSSFEPYIYLETNNKEDIFSIFNTKLKKKRFKNQAERYRFLKDNKVERVFENLNVQQQFLIDTYWKDNEKEDFNKHPIKVLFIDIETYSPDEFPSPSNPEHPINVITVFDSLRRQFITWGLKSYSKKNPNSLYFKCNSEKELLEKFLKYFQSDYPDILSGWNSEFFDIPYIINRMTKILGEDETKNLSPVRNLRPITFMGKFGREQVHWHIEGVSCVDYLDIYKRFCPVLRESYKLDTIGNIELGENKIDYGDTNLSSLADQNWELFVDYNIQDVNLLIKLEDKLQYLELLRMIAYAGLTTFEGALGSLSVITGLCAIRARHRNQRIPTFNKGVKENDEQNAGAYVGEPKKGFQENIVSFDANSLYPNVMITLNLSPETKIGSIVNKTDKEVTIKHVNGQQFSLTTENFLKFVNKEQISISKAKVLFSQKEKGIIPETVDHYYEKRVELKRQLKNAKKKLASLTKKDEDYNKVKMLVDNLNIQQHTIKILINTIYGYFGNKHSPLGDDELAESITLTGQAVIKQSNKLLIDYIKQKGHLTDEDILQDTPIIYNDTDSSYISIKHLVKKLELKMVDSNGKVTNEYYKTVQDIEDYLNVEIKKWGSTALNSKDCRLNFKREAIADVGLFLQKKRYVLHILDEEGIPCNKFKYTGVEVVRTTMPAPIKPHVKRIIETMLTTKSLTETNKAFTETYDLFKTLTVDDIAFVMGCKGYEKYAAQCDNFATAKHMPIHVKAAYYHNLLLDRFKIDKKYEKIGSGDKVRFFYTRQPNKYGISVMGYKYYFPKEFISVLEPDHEKMFEKIVFSVIERFYEAVNWKLKAPGAQVQTDLFELLGS
jgi:DNA polymerase elongation subunit (family B)